jgi:hypothetical protein
MRFFGTPPANINYTRETELLRGMIIKCRNTNSALKSSIEDLIARASNQNRNFGSSVTKLLNDYKAFTDEMQGIRIRITDTQKRFKNDISKINVNPSNKSNSLVQLYLKRSMFSSRYVVKKMPPINKMQDILGVIRHQNNSPRNKPANVGNSAQNAAAAAAAAAAAKAQANKTTLENLLRRVGQNNNKLRLLSKDVSNNGNNTVNVIVKKRNQNNSSFGL